MSNYNNRNYNSGGGRSGGGYRGRDSGRREMFSAVCDECGNNCEVPFRPSGDKPIYCSACFEGKGGSGGGSSNRSDQRSQRGTTYEKTDDTNKKLLEQVTSLNSKLDRVLKVLEKGNKKEVKAEPIKVEKQEVQKEVKEEPKKEKKEVKKVAKKVAPKEEKPEEKKATKKIAEKATPKE